MWVPVKPFWICYLERRVSLEVEPSSSNIYMWRWWFHARFTGNYLARQSSGPIGKSSDTNQFRVCVFGLKMQLCKQCWNYYCSFSVELIVILFQKIVKMYILSQVMEEQLNMRLEHGALYTSIWRFMYIKSASAKNTIKWISNQFSSFWMLSIHSY